MARPRKIKEEPVTEQETINGVPVEEVEDVIARLNKKKPANAGFPVFVTDPGSSVVKRLWSDEDVKRHLARGWIHNG